MSANTCCSNMQDADRLYVPLHQLDRVSRYVGGDDSRPMLNKLGSGRMGEDAAKGRAAQPPTLRATCSSCTPQREMVTRPRLQQGHALADRAGVELPLHRNRRPVARHPGSEARHGTGQPDGSPDLRRCGLWQDRSGAARRVQGRAGRQAGGRAGADHGAGAATLEHLLPPAWRLSGAQSRCCRAFARRPRRQEVLRRPRPMAPSTSSSARTRCSAKRCSSSNLGLLIIDEEQRFGVKAKEKLKQLRTEVDVLTLTATPIPRTLYLGLSGVRDISRIETPPAERLPIISYVGACDDVVVQQAIQRELDRDGQVFFVHNRIQTDSPGGAEAAPAGAEATMAVAHGQMEERALARIMNRFADGKVEHPAVHQHHRERPRHPQRQHHHHRPRRSLWPGRVVPTARARGPHAPFRPMPISCTTARAA